MFIKKYILLIIFVITFITAATYYNKTALFLVNILALTGEYNLYNNISYTKNKQKLDLYISDKKKKSENTPTVIFFYGGCWGACSKLNKSDYRFIAQAFTENNINVVIADYQKFPAVRYPTIISDAGDAVEWVSENIERFGGSNKNIFLMGHSAGAHLAAMLNFNRKLLSPNVYKKIKGFIGLAGAYDFLPFDEDYQPALFSPLKSPLDSQPVNFVTGNEPASLLLYGTADTRIKRRNIISLTKEINKKKGAVQAIYYNGTDHTGIIGALSIPLRSSQPVLKDIITFIEIHSRQ